jgi:hypothetical protein
VYQKHTFLFDCAFDAELDDYPDFYRVYLLPELKEEDLPTDWTTLRSRATRYLGEISVGQVHFDPSKRQSIDVAIFKELGVQKAVAG